MLNGDNNHDWRKCKRPGCGKYVPSDKSPLAVYCCKKCQTLENTIRSSTKRRLKEKEQNG